MQIIESKHPVFLPESGVMLNPFTRYVVSDYEAIQLQRHSPNAGWKMSSFNSYERRYAGQPLGKDDSVLIYRHTAFGDQLMISAIPRYIKTIYPDSTVHLCCENSMTNMWWKNTFTGGCALAAPMILETVMRYTYHIFYQGMLENNWEKDQRCCYDDAFSFCGLHNVPDIYKKPYIEILPGDYDFLKTYKIALPDKYIVYHMSPANKNRQYPPALGMEFVDMFLRAQPDHSVVLIGQSSDLQGVVQLDTDRVLNLIDKTKEFRSLIPIIERADCLVCPDSSVMHLAAALNTPTVSLWGILPASARMKYYPNHVALENTGACKHSPCCNHDFELPLDLCVDTGLNRKLITHCQALASIEPAMIQVTVSELMQKGGK